LSDVGYTVSLLGVSASGVIAGLPNAATLLTFLHPNGVTKAAGSSQGVISATFSASEQTFDYLWAGETVTLTYTLQVADGHGGTSTQTVTVTATGTNDGPVINGGPIVASVQEDAGAGSMASSQLTVTDPDLSDTHTWTVVGGSSRHAPNYQFKIDEFKITKNNGLFFDDSFDGGGPPPSVPSGFGPTSYTVTGTILEQGGKAVLTGANAGFGTGSPTGDPFFGEYATLNTNIDPTNTTQGLKDNSSFTVSGLFDLTLPQEDRNEYGIRLTDRTATQAGDSTVELRVARGADGIVRVQLREIDFASGTRTVLQSFNLNPGTHDKILLTLTHDVIDGQVVHASFQLGTTDESGIHLDAATNFNPEIPATIFSGENWTRAQFFAEAPAESDSVLQGTYGQLDITQAGAWTYQLANGQANVQALAAGQPAQDFFTVQVADGSGATDTKTITVNITGTNDAPTPVANTVAVNEDATVAATTRSAGVLGNDTDPDAGETSTLVVSAVRPGTTGTVTPLNGGTAVVNGTYGTLTIHSDGTYSYTPNNAAAETLSQGTHANDVFTYTAKDVQGATATTTLTFNVTGQNDAPVAMADTASISEDALPNTVIGNVLTNDTDVDIGDLHTVSAVTGGTDNGTTITKVGTYGTLVITKATGGYTYTLGSSAQALTQGQQVNDVFTYTNSDNHGGSNSSTLTVTVTGVNDAPFITSPAATVRVSEEGLSNGVADTLPSELDTTNNTSAGGTITATDAENDALTMTFGTPSTSLSSGGVAIAWTFADSNHTLIGKAGATTIVTATITDAGAYNVTLSGPIDHSDNSQEDTKAFSIPVNVSDGHTTTPTTVSVTVEDDSPKAQAVEVSVDTASDTNVMVILDRSGSMNSNAGLVEHPTWTRLEAAIAAIEELLDEYDSRGDVRVQIVKFSDIGEQVGTDWMTVEDAKAALVGLSANGSTNYDEALDKAMAIFGNAGKLSGSGVQNVSYFLSDGEPSAQHGVDSGLQQDWENFLTSNDIVSFALGISDGSPGEENLAPIAYDGASETDLEPIIVTDLDQLEDTLVLTASSASGSLLSGANSFGADGGYVNSITVDGVTYTFNPTANTITASNGSTPTYNTSTKILTVETDAGGSELAVVMTTGAFTFQPTSGFTSESVGFTLTDADGDTASSTLQLTGNTLPAGIAGSPINLGLTDPAGHVGPVMVTIAGIPIGWTVSGGTDNGYGVWTVQADNVSTLSITSPDDYAGAMAFKVTMNWTNADQSVGHIGITDNVEAFPQGAPIFAWSGDDHLTGSGAADLFVFARPIGLDTIYSFDTGQDRIDLIGYAGFANFNDVQRHLSEDSAGNAVLALAAGQSITLMGVAAAALTAGNFLFDRTPVLNNPATMTISDGALLPLSGMIDNAGTIALDAAARDTHLQLIQNGVTLQGGGELILSDSAHNFISGSLPGVTLTNVDNTISGAGQLGAGQMTLVNDGTIVATGFHALVIDTGANVVANSGTLAVAGAAG
jgi:VCBS repeat-containing protein